MLKESAFILCLVSLYVQVLVMSLININLVTLQEEGGRKKESRKDERKK